MTKSEWDVIEEALEGGRIAFVSESGRMILVYPDGEWCIVTVPRDSVQLFRRLAVMQQCKESLRTPSA